MPSRILPVNSFFGFWLSSHLSTFDSLDIRDISSASSLTSLDLMLDLAVVLVELYTFYIWIVFWGC